MKNKIKLKDCCKNITDGEHCSISDDCNGLYFLLSNQNLVNGSVSFDKNNSRKINEDTFKMINSRCKLEYNDVLISTVGTLGKVSIIKDDFINYVFQRSVGIIKTNSKIILPKYLYYLLQTKYIQKQLLNNSKGGVQKCIFINDLKEVEFELPSIMIQNKLINILEKIDEKININNHINDNLCY